MCFGDVHSLNAINICGIITRRTLNKSRLKRTYLIIEIEISK